MSATILPQDPYRAKISLVKDSISKGVSSYKRFVPSQPKKDEPSIMIEPVGSPMSEVNIDTFGACELEGTPKTVEESSAEIEVSVKKHALPRKAVASLLKDVAAAAEATNTKLTGKRRPALARTEHPKKQKDHDKQGETQDDDGGHNQDDIDLMRDGFNDTIQEASPDIVDSMSKVDLNDFLPDNRNDKQADDDVLDQQNDNTVDESAWVDDDAVQADGDAGSDTGLGDVLAEVPIDDLELSSEQTAKIMAQVKKYLDSRKEAREKVISGYKAYANAWLTEVEYGYRGQDGEVASKDMQTYLNTELPEMLRMHSGRVGRNWRLNAWALASGGAGLLPYGKPVLSAVARLRTKQIISEQFAIPKILTKKARKKEEKKAKKAKVNKKAQKKAETKKEKAAKVAKWAAQQAATAAVNEAVGVPKEAVSGAFSEAASEVLSSSVGEQLSGFFSDLTSEMFFGSVEELIHFAPIYGQAYSAWKGFSKTRAQVKIDIKEALETAIEQHGKTVIPETMTQ